MVKSSKQLDPADLVPLAALCASHAQQAVFQPPTPDLSNAQKDQASTHLAGFHTLEARKCRLLISCKDTQEGKL